jgi:hypothetical protein
MATHNLTVMNHAAIHGKKGFKGKHGQHGYGIGMGGKHGKDSGYGTSKKDKKNKSGVKEHKTVEGDAKGGCDACTIF